MTPAPFELFAGHATGHVLATRRGKQIEAEAASDDNVRQAIHLETLQPIPALACPWLDKATGTWQELRWDEQFTEGEPR